MLNRPDSTTNNTDMTSPGSKVIISTDLFSYNGNLTVTLNNLDNILNNPEYANKKIIVIGIIGTMRSGKSFLMNYILRFLKNNFHDPLNQNLEKPLEGFPWKYGINTVTNGLNIWSELIITKIGGEDAVVILLDTQGIYNKLSKIDDDIKIAATTLILSSILIVNVQKNLDENICSFLQLMANYAKNNLKINYYRKPFQNIAFVIRDWHTSTIFPHGFDGGIKYMNMVSKAPRHSSAPILDGHFYKTMYNDVCCYLLPHPGEKAVYNTMFDGRICDLDIGFVENLRKFLNTLFNPEFLDLKAINECYLNCKDLMKYLNSFMTCIQNETIGHCDNILMENANLKKWESIDYLSNYYISQMDKFIFSNEQCYNKERFMNEHLQIEQNILDKLSNVVIVSKRLVREDLYKLTKEQLNLLLQRYSEDNKYKHRHMGMYTPFSLLGISMVLFVIQYLINILTHMKQVIYLSQLAWFLSVFLIFLWVATVFWEIEELSGIMDGIADLLNKYFFNHVLNIITNKQTKTLEIFFRSMVDKFEDL